jgi:hypothetical protein
MSLYSEEPATARLKLSRENKKMKIMSVRVKLNRVIEFSDLIYIKNVFFFLVKFEKIQ